MGYHPCFKVMTGAATLLLLVSTNRCLANPSPFFDLDDFQEEVGPGENEINSLAQNYQQSIPLDDMHEEMMDEDHEYSDQRNTRKTNNAFKQVAVDYHNKYRRLHGSPDVVLDNKLSAQAQKWAEYLSTKSDLEHAKNIKEGENLSGSGKKSKADATRDAIERWYNEIRKYDFNKPGYRQAIGHFTQIVWKKTKKIGVGISWNAKKKWWTVVVRYSPSGNVKGEFPANVMRAKSG